MIEIGDASRETLALLTRRTAGAMICPSEVARALAAEATDEPGAMHWRDAIPVVHTAVDQLVTDGAVQLSWKGELLKTRVGPYRIMALPCHR